MDLLILLVEHRGQLISRAQIVDRLWGADVFIEVDTGVNTAIRKIRQALHDSPDAPVFVETVQGKGYRFMADVEVVRAAEVPLILPAISTPAGNVGGESSPTPLEPVAVGGRAPRNRARLVTGVVAVVLIVGGLTWAGILGVQRSRVTVAVMPFEHLSGDPEREYVTDGLTEETSTLLGQIDPDHVSVIGGTSTRAYKGTKKSLAEIGRELGAEYLVEGSVRTENQRLRVTSKLIRASNQVQIWSASYDSELGSMLELQRELSTTIAEQIRMRISPDKRTALSYRHTRDAEAYDLYLQGRYFWNQLTPQTTRRAVEFFSRATELDPDYALAWSGLADTYSTSPSHADASPITVWPRAREAVAQAIRVKPTVAEAQISLGYLKFFLDWDWPAAETAFRKATDLDPNNPLGHRMVGLTIAHMGRHEEAARIMRRARELDPLYALHYATSAQVAFWARDYEAAERFARQSTVVDPQFWIGYLQLGQAYEALGRHELAVDALNTAGRLSGGNSKAIAIRGYMLAKLGRTNEALDVLGLLKTISSERYMPPYAIALVHAGLGQADMAFQWLERAYDVRDVHLIYLPVDPKWDAFRQDPRFRAFLGRCGFAGPATSLTSPTH